MTAIRPHPSISVKSIGTSRRSSPGLRRRRTSRDETEMRAPLTQEPATNPRSPPQGSPQSRLPSPGSRHSPPLKNSERSPSASTESSGEDEANVTSYTPHHIDLTDSDSEDDKETPAPHQPLPVPIFPYSAPTSPVHNIPRPTSSNPLERHLAQLEARWNETCEELQEVVRKAEDTFNTPEML
ncbi:hypothetical protein BGZ47_004307, partial [Haplosporangium gracile]